MRIRNLTIAVLVTSLWASVAPAVTPVISSISPKTGAAKGTLTLNGSNLTNTANVVVTVGGKVCSLLPIVSSSAQCYIPFGDGTVPVKLSNLHGTSNTVYFTYDATPAIETYSPTQVAPGQTLTLQGYRFGTAAAVDFGGMPCQVTAQTTSRISCIVPTLYAGTPVTVSVVVNGLRSNPLRLDYLAPYTPGASTSTGPTPTPVPSGQGSPTITSVSPAAGRPGGTLQVYGSGFGSVPTVSVGTSPCAVTSLSSTALACTLYSGVGTNVPVTVSASGLRSNSVPFTYLVPPVINRISPTEGGAGGTLSIAGAGFGLSGATVTIGTFPCPVTGQTDTQVSCSIQGNGQSASVTVKNATTGYLSNPATFTYLGPWLTDISPLVASGGTTLIVVGNGLGTSPTVMVGDAPCPVTSVQTGHVECTIPQGTPGEQVPVVLTDTVSGRVSNSVPFTYYQSGGVI